MVAEITRVGPAEMLRALGDGAQAANFYRAAYGSRRSLSTYLEDEMPRAEGDSDADLDGFERLLKHAGIRVRSVPEDGVWASPWSAFFEKKETRALVPEFLARCARRAAMGQAFHTRAPLSSMQGAVGSTTNQKFFSMMPRADKQIAPAIPLASVIAMTEGIDRGTYEAWYYTDSAANQRMVRVTEFSEIPELKIASGDNSIKLFKYGRKILTSYEQLRRSPIDKVALVIQRTMVQAEVDKLAAVIDVMVSGDGNTGTAATSFNLTTLDSGAVAGTLSLKGWLRFKKKFVNPYMLETALMQDDIAVQLELLNAGSANVPMVMYGQQSGYVSALRPINQSGDGVGYGWTPDAPANKIVGSDTRTAIERVFEIGANIQEVERFVTNQTEVLVLTEAEGYMVMDPGASKILVVNA